MKSLKKVTSLLLSFLMVVSIFVLPISAAEKDLVYVGKENDWSAAIGATKTYTVNTIEEAQLYLNDLVTLQPVSVVIDGSIINNSEYLENVLLSLLEVTCENAAKVTVVFDGEIGAATADICENFDAKAISLAEAEEGAEASYITKNLAASVIDAPVPELKKSSLSRAMLPVNQLDASATLTDASAIYTTYGSYLIIKTSGEGSYTVSIDGGASGNGGYWFDESSTGMVSAYRIGDRQHSVKITATGTVIIEGIYSESKPIYESLVNLGFEDNNISVFDTLLQGNTSWAKLEWATDDEQGGVAKFTGVRTDRNAEMRVPVMLRHGSAYEVSARVKILSKTAADGLFRIRGRQLLKMPGVTDDEITTQSQTIDDATTLINPEDGWTTVKATITPEHETVSKTIDGTAYDMTTSEYGYIVFYLGSGFSTDSFLIDDISIAPVSTGLPIRETNVLYDFENGETFESLTADNGYRKMRWVNKASAGATKFAIQAEKDNAENTVMFDDSTSGTEILRVGGAVLYPGKIYNWSFKARNTGTGTGYSMSWSGYRSNARQVDELGQTPVVATVTAAPTVQEDSTMSLTNEWQTFSGTFFTDRDKVTDYIGGTEFILNLKQNNANVSSLAKDNGAFAMEIDDFSITPAETDNLTYSENFDGATEHKYAKSSADAVSVADTGDSAHGKALKVSMGDFNNTASKPERTFENAVVFYPAMLLNHRYKISFDAKIDDLEYYTDATTGTTADNAILRLNVDSPATYADATRVQRTDTTKSITEGDWQTYTYDITYGIRGAYVQRFPLMYVGLWNAKGILYIDNIKVEDITLETANVHKANQKVRENQRYRFIFEDSADAVKGYVWKIHEGSKIYASGEWNKNRIMFANYAPEGAKLTLSISFVRQDGLLGGWHEAYLGEVVYIADDVKALFTASDFTVGEKLSASVTFRAGNADQNVVAMLAVYDENNKLLNLAQNTEGTVGIIAYDTKTITVESLALTNDAHHAKLFVWNGTDRIKPHVKEVTIIKPEAEEQ